MIRLEEEQGPVSCSEGDDAFEEFRVSETLLVFCKQGKGGMSILGNAACKEDGKGDKASCIQGDEYQVRTGFRYDADGHGEQYHNGRVAADPSAYVYIFRQYPDQEEHTESPGEYHGEVSGEYMVPECLFYEPVRTEA